MPNFTGGIVASAARLTALNSTTGVSLAFWYRKTLGGGNTGTDIFCQSDNANPARNGIFLHIPAATMAVTLNIQSATASTASSGTRTTAAIQSGRWAHYAVTFNNTGDFVRFYVDGDMVTTATNATNLTAVAGCTTRIGPNATVSGFGYGQLFDFQLLPNFVATPVEVQNLMDPRKTHPNMKARWFGLEYVSPGAGGVIRDQSGNGNNLTASASSAAATAQGAEPPWRSTLA